METHAVAATLRAETRAVLADHGGSSKTITLLLGYVSQRVKPNNLSIYLLHDTYTHYVRNAAMPGWAPLTPRHKWHGVRR
jgi:hypothetical protein